MDEGRRPETAPNIAPDIAPNSDGPFWLLLAASFTLVVRKTFFRHTLAVWSDQICTLPIMVPLAAAWCGRQPVQLTYHDLDLVSPMNASSRPFSRDHNGIQPSAPFP